MGKQWKQWLTLFFWAPKSLQMVIAAMKLKDAYSLEGKLWLRVGHDWSDLAAAAAAADSILESRDISLSTKVCLVKATVFPVVMYGYESWTMKKAERQRIDAFELWCWRRLLRVPWTERRSNQSILEEISPGCSLEGLMLKLKLQYFGHLMRRSDSFEKTLVLRKIDQEEKGTTEDEMVGCHHWLNGHGFGWTPGVGNGQGSLVCCGSWGRKESDTTERLEWSEVNWYSETILIKI